MSFPPAGGMLDGMSDPNLFWTIFAAVLSAIMLGGTFFWGLIAYNKHERGGTAGNRASSTPLLAILLPLVVGGIAFYIAMGGH